MCSSCKHEIFVKDFREVMTHNKKRIRFPKNYDKIVESGRIKVVNETEDDVYLKLLYGKEDNKGMRPSFNLTRIFVKSCCDSAYYAISALDGTDPEDVLHKSYFEAFGFSRIICKKYTPVVLIQNTGDSEEPYQLMNSFHVAKKGCISKPDGTSKVNPTKKEIKMFNGEILYYSNHGMRDINFCLIRDENSKVVTDASIAVFPVVLVGNIVKVCGKLVTFLPMKLGSCLLRKQNVFAKIFGHIFFTPFVPIKFGMDLASVISKSPVLLFVHDRKKYADGYVTLWKHEFIECFHELISDCSIIKNGKRPEREVDSDIVFVGTWKELNAAGSQQYQK